MTVANWIQEAYSNKTWLMTRGGDKRRVICVDAPDRDYPVMTLNESGDILWHDHNGLLRHGDTCPGDLLPPKRQFDVCVMTASLDDNLGQILHTCLARDIPGYIEEGWTLLARATIEEGSGLE